MTRFQISEAAELLGVSPDTVRRWTDTERLPATRDANGFRSIAGADLAAFLSERGGGQDEPTRSSARNRMSGLVIAIKANTVMAQVEIQAGPHRIVSLMSRQSLDELGLEVGSPATAVIKSTTVIVEKPR